MLKPICVGCQRFYRPYKNSFPFIEGMPTTNEAPPGTAAPALWKPYKLWIGDLWKCPGCDHEIVVGSGQAPVSEHFMPSFKTYVEKFKATYQVNDC